MSIRQEALRWFSSNYPIVDEAIYCSKYYKPTESWNRQALWWFEIPLKAIEIDSEANLHLICEMAPGKNEFHYLSIPKKYVSDNLDKLYVRKELVSIYISAEPEKMFVEQRGTGEVRFEKFKQVEK